MTGNEKIAARIHELLAFGATLPHAKVYHRQDWDTNYFEICGKCFGLMSVVASEESIITLKGIPEKNEELRELYQDIIPGYYTNKKHWNSVKLVTNALSMDEIKEMVRLSYQLVFDKLPLKVRKELTD